jgi:hypothetical protein
MPVRGVRAHLVGQAGLQQRLIAASVQAPPAVKPIIPGIEGKLTLLDARQHLIGITPRIGAEIRLKVEDTTKLVIGGKASSFTDLTSELVGHRVVATYEPGATLLVALQVTVQG